ncbi:MAG: M28 family peptidase [Anaerolineae bacterium]|jgi:aminopeptidase YwaD
MKTSRLAGKADTYLRKLCLDIPHRRLGSQGNRQATDFFTQWIASLGLGVHRQEFDCLDWTHGTVRLAVDGEPFAVMISPYSLGCRVTAPLIVASALDELEALDAQDKILLLRGELAKEQLVPKNYPFYGSERHQRIIHLLESGNPSAIIGATSRNPATTAALYPFPLIEDGDFNIPAVHMTDVEGDRLAAHAGRAATLVIEATRIPSQGCNVVARCGPDVGPRVIVCAHIDTKEGTPGALDNAAGITTLLLLAELLQDYGGRLSIEIVAFNGEDDYSAAGEIEYLLRSGESFHDIKLGINLDAMGYCQGKTAYTLYGCPEEMAAAIRGTFSSREGLVEGDPWYQSDHSLFIQQQVPAMAITSERFTELSAQVSHTAKDRPQLVDRSRLVDVALVLRDLLRELDNIL